MTNLAQDVPANTVFGHVHCQATPRFEITIAVGVGAMSSLRLGVGHGGGGKNKLKKKTVGCFGDVGKCFEGVWVMIGEYLGSVLYVVCGYVGGTYGFHD